MSVMLQVVQTTPTHQRAEVGSKHSAMFPPLRRKKKERERERGRDGAQKEAPVILVGAPKKSSLSSWIGDYLKTKGDRGTGAEPKSLRMSEAEINEISNTTTCDETQPS